MHDPHQLLRVTLESVRDAVVATDDRLYVQILNPAAEAMTGWSREEAAGKFVQEIVELRQPGTDKPQPLGHELPISIAHSPAPCLLLHRDGRRIAVQVTATPIHDPHDCVAGWLLVFHDVSEAMHLAESLAYGAQYDPVTGLPNRILLVDRLEQGVRIADRNNELLAVLFLHAELGVVEGEVGWQAEARLKEIAFRISATLRESDTVCRLGGLDFVALLLGVQSLKVVELVAGKLVKELAQPLAVAGSIVAPMCHIGISFYPRDASDVSTLMHLADGAMQQSRQKGTSGYLYARPGMDANAAGQEPVQTEQDFSVDSEA